MKIKEYISNKLNQGISKNIIISNICYQGYDRIKIYELVREVEREIKASKPKPKQIKILLTIDEETKEIIDRAFENKPFGLKSEVFRKSIKHFLKKHYNQNGKNNNLP